MAGNNAGNDKACARVWGGATEVLENILLRLASPNVVRIKRFHRKWKNIIYSPPKLRQHIFLDNMSVTEPEYEDFARNFKLDFEKTETWHLGEWRDMFLTSPPAKKVQIQWYDAPRTISEKRGVTVGQLVDLLSIECASMRIRLRAVIDDVEGAKVHVRSRDCVLDGNASAKKPDGGYLV
ncbi:hypothetical protein DOTSEDRAFT_36789 [Dothistroma septosporum NZE10]|uniref:F-box domain-containing protein n=1 Tax=Dothistroma septosporum (strain NZE10 / CBS 128990) TaxID=675120 RepID=N1PIK4_DOTSN|nr:hypothetical protein DOTSEDRAFT_36789 [Dothistroma septosporum NZE10]